MAVTASGTAQYSSRENPQKKIKPDHNLANPGGTISGAKPGLKANQHHVRQNVAFLSCACNGIIHKIFYKKTNRLNIEKFLMVLSSLTGRWADRRAILVALFIATTAHAGVYLQFSAQMNNPAPVSVPSSVVSVSLLAVPASVAEPEPEPQTDVTPPVKPVAKVPAPKPGPEPVAKMPVPKPTPEPVKKKRVAKTEPPATPAAQPQPVEVAASRVAAVESEPAMVDLPVILPRADAAYLENPPPKYPRTMLRRGIEGTVLVSAQVFDDGHCHHVKLKESSGHRLLDEAALSAVKSWQFVPARKGDMNIVAWVDIPIDFRITRRQ